MSFIKNIYIHSRFFLISGILILFFILSFPFPFILPVAKSLLVFFVAITILDALLLFRKNVRFECKRVLPNMMSLGNENETQIVVKNHSNSFFNVLLINELPYQFQERNSSYKLRLKPAQEELLEIPLRPVARGEYYFGSVLLFTRTIISILERKIPFDYEQMVPVYPSILDLKKYEFYTTRQLTNFIGVKKIRRIGQSYEFEQISEYQKGDNYQSINWKATSKTRRLMVNKYTDEKSQPIYSFIDKSRYMKMPFYGMSLLDYSINASLIIANSVLKRDDKAGLLTFSDQIESHIRSDKRRDQMSRILETLYRESETKKEANYERMFSYIRKSISGRSLIFLFSNFDTIPALERVIPVLRKINKMHLLVVIVFKNTELEAFYQSPSESVEEIYDHTIAQKVSFEKRQIIFQLRQHAIQVIYTKPEELSVNTMNKYLELKSRGMI